MVQLAREWFTMALDRGLVTTKARLAMVAPSIPKLSGLMGIQGPTARGVFKG